MITLRLDQNLEEAVSSTARHLGITKSDLIRQSILEYLNKIDKPDAWETGRDLFGKYSSGKGNLSADRKSILRKKLKAKKDEKNSD